MTLVTLVSLDLQKAFQQLTLKSQAWRMAKSAQGSFVALCFESFMLTGLLLAFIHTQQT